MKQRLFTRSSILATLLLTLAIAIPEVLRAQAFEGEISMQMASPMMGAQKMDIVYSIKGTKVLQTADDPQAGKVAVYNDSKDGTQVIVRQAQKRGMQIDQKMIDSLSLAMKMPLLIPKPTGKKEKIAGYECELYSIVLDSANEMDIWLTKDLPKNVTEAIKNCTEVGMKTTGMKSDALIALLNKGYAEIRMEVKQNGVTQMTNEFVKAEPKKLADTIFVIPADIIVTKFNPAAMGGAPGQ